MNLTLTESTVAAPAPVRPPSARPGRSLWGTLAVANFLALVGVALLLRGWQLGNIPGLNGDEAWLGVQAAHLVAGEPIAWRTPTGNPVNVFLLLPVAALHLVFGPSVVVLRSISVASGVAALGVNFWLCRRVFDRRAALVSTAALAVLPIAIAYSRFAWDTSQTILATTVVLYFALSTIERQIAIPEAGSDKNKQWLRAPQSPPDWLPALLALGVALWIHPTNVFALWLLLVPAVYRYGEDWRAAVSAAWERTGSEPWGQLKRSLAAAALGVLVLMGAALCRGLLATAAARLVNPDEAGLFVRRLVRLFSGGTISEFIPGPPRTSTGLETDDLALVSLVSVAILGLVHRLRRADSARERRLAWAVALMLGSFYLVAGPDALAPHFERYGMCLVAPCAVLLSLGWSQWLGNRGIRSRAPGDAAASAKSSAAARSSGHARVVALALLALGWLWLADFYCDYFRAIRSSGGTSHVAFRTAAIEPKLSALRAIVCTEHGAGGVLKKWDKPLTGTIPPDDAPAAGEAETGKESAASGLRAQVWVVADSWWTYWPLTYFAVGRPRFHIVAEDQWLAERQNVGPADAVWRVRFVAADATAVPASTVVANDPPTAEITIRDYKGAPLLSVDRLAPAEGSAVGPGGPKLETPAAQADRFDIGRK